VNPPWYRIVEVSTLASKHYLPIFLLPQPAHQDDISRVAATDAIHTSLDVGVSAGDEFDFLLVAMVGE
jgi:hypothetical protein